MTLDWDRSIRNLMIHLVLLSLMVLMMVAPTSASESLTAPTQPVTGPGGSERTYAGYVAQHIGEAPTGYWLYEPREDDGSIVTETMPLIIFLHGFLAVDPVQYEDWLIHLVRGGAVIVYPDYQSLNPLTFDPARYLERSVIAIEDAVAMSDNAGRTPLDLKRVAVVGHSVGGVLAANYAAIATDSGLPVPDVLLSVEPGGCAGCQIGPERFAIPFEDLGLVAPETLAMVIVGDQDNVVGDAGGKEIFARMSNVLLTNRDFVTMQSDDHGSPELVADHLMPLAGGRISADALDWYGSWKFLDSMMLCAFDGSLCDRALGGTAFQQFMGRWSDGQPVIQPIISKTPALD